MTHRRMLLAMSGLMLAIFAAGLSSTIVANALPTIIRDLRGTGSQYTWVVTSTILAATASGPIWGKLADRTGKKPLTQVSVALMSVGMLAAGFAPNTMLLIGLRAVEGVGAGGLIALAQTVIASIAAPRERGRYMAYFSAAGAAATVSAPSIGGVIVATPHLGWRWCFWAGVPITVAAMLLVHKTLRVPLVTADTAIDWQGAALIPGGICLLLVWFTFAGTEFAWISWPSFALLSASVALIAVAVHVERSARDPIISPRLLRRRTVALAIVAWIAIGVPMISAPVFFAQYFQLARGYPPAESGVLTLPMVAALVASTAACGRMVRRTGRWKRLLVGGTTLVVVALLLLGTIDRSTPVPLLGAYMAILGLGIGASSQNIVVAAQNALARREMGTGTATLTFFHLLGGAAGLSVLGTVFATSVAGTISRTAYGNATAFVFLVTAAVAAVAVIAVLFIRETPLATSDRG